MLKFNASELTRDERGRSKVILSSYLKPLIMGFIAGLAFFSIVKTNINKLNTLKSQTLALKKSVILNYEMKSDLLPVHQFTELT